MGGRRKHRIRIENSTRTSRIVNIKRLICKEGLRLGFKQFLVSIRTSRTGWIIQTGLGLKSNIQKRNGNVGKLAGKKGLGFKQLLVSTRTSRTGWIIQTGLGLKSDQQKRIGNVGKLAGKNGLGLKQGLLRIRVIRTGLEKYRWD